jgi:hypothetical protein
VKVLRFIKKEECALGPEWAGDCSDVLKTGQSLRRTRLDGAKLLRGFIAKVFDPQL